MQLSFRPDRLLASLALSWYEYAEAVVPCQRRPVRAEGLGAGDGQLLAAFNSLLASRHLDNSGLKAPGVEVYPGEVGQPKKREEQRFFKSTIRGFRTPLVGEKHDGRAEAVVAYRKKAPEGGGQRRDDEAKRMASNMVKRFYDLGFLTPKRLAQINTELYMENSIGSDLSELGGGEESNENRVRAGDLAWSSGRHSEDLLDTSIKVFTGQCPANGEAIPTGTYLPPGSTARVQLLTGRQENYQLIINYHLPDVDSHTYYRWPSVRKDYPIGLLDGLEMYSPFGGLIWLLCRRRPGWVQELSKNNKKRHTKGSIRSPKRRLRDKLNGEVDIKDIFYTKQTWNDDIEAINMPEERDGEEAPAEEDDEVEYSTTTIRLALEGVELTANFDLLDHLKSDQQSYAGTRADVRRASSWLAQSLIWPRRQRRLRAPWATVSGESLVLAVPSRAVAQLTRPQRALQWMDAGISEAWRLAGITVNHLYRREVVSADIQAGEHEVLPGHPIILSWKSGLLPSSPDYLLRQIDLAPLAKTNAVLKEPSKEVSLRKAEILCIHRPPDRMHWNLFNAVGSNLRLQQYSFIGAQEEVRKALFLPLAPVCHEVIPKLFALAASEVALGAPSWNALEGWMQYRGVLTEVSKFLESGANYDEWKRSPWLALTFFTQIRHHFGWSALQLVFLGFANQYGELATAINNEDILTLWMEELKYRLQHDFRPFFVFWGLPLVARSSSENNHDYTAMQNRIESGKSNTEQMLPGFLPVDLVTNLAPERLLRVAKQFGVDLDDTTKNTKNLSIPSDAPQLGSMGWRKKVASGVLSWWPCQDRDLSPHQAGFSRVSEIQVSTDDDNEDTKYEEEDEEEESHPQSNEKHSRMGLIQLVRWPKWARLFLDVMRECKPAERSEDLN